MSTEVRSLSNYVEQMTLIGMTVESEGSVSGHQEAMVILFYCFDKIPHNSAIQEFSKSISKKND